MILSCQNIRKAFGTDVILKNASFHIEDREKAAVVGINGAAQHQDLLSSNTIYEELLTVKQEVLDLERDMHALERRMKELSGEDLEAALSQYTRLSHEFEQRNGYACKSEVVGVLKGLGFEEEDFEKQVNTLSGGQKTRVSLGKLLLSFWTSPRTIWI